MMIAKANLASNSIAQLSVLSLLCLMAVGCATTGSVRQLGQAHTAYDAGDYQAALRQATTVANDTQMPIVYRSEAAYLAGMSSWRLGNRSQAIDFLRQASASTDRELAGQANASLGLIYAEQNEHQRAAQRLKQASEQLTGEPRANALFFAALSQQKMGQTANARSNLILARSATSNSELLRRIEQQLNVFGYTLQVGAFSRPENARQQADRVAQATRNMNLGSPRLVSHTDRAGRSLTAVQIGQFSTTQAADEFRRRLSQFQPVVVPLSQR